MTNNKPGGAKRMIRFLEHLYVRLFNFGRFNFIFFKGQYFDSFCSEGWHLAYRSLKLCRKMKTNRNVRWPVSPQIRIQNPNNIIFDFDDLHNFWTYGVYYQAIGQITIGKGIFIGPNVGIITANHNFEHLEKHYNPKPVVIGKNCWIGMNSIILPGVILGDNTIVGAGSVVTKSFEDGAVIIAGNPAKIIRKNEHS